MVAKLRPEVAAVERVARTMVLERKWGRRAAVEVEPGAPELLLAAAAAVLVGRELRPPALVAEVHERIGEPASMVS